MSNRWWNPFDGMEQIAFKPVAEGYVYRAPNPWLFGPGRYYLVNEAQKAELIVPHRRIMQLTFWMIVGAAGLLGPLSGAFVASHNYVVLGASLAVGLAIGFALNLYLVRMVRPIVAGLKRTTGRITRRDVFKTQATVFSSRTAIVFALLDFALFALVVWSAVYGPNGWDVIAITGTALFGCGAIYFAALAMAQRKRVTA